MDSKKTIEKLEEIQKLAGQIGTGHVSVGAVATRYGVRIQKLVAEVLTEVEEARVRVFDNGGVSFDRYTVFIGGDVFTMSPNPMSPQGVNQWAGSCAGSIAVLEPGVIPVLGDELRSDQVPPEVREAIEQRRKSTRFVEEKR